MAYPSSAYTKLNTSSKTIKSKSMGKLSNYLNRLFHPKYDKRSGALENVAIKLGMDYDLRDKHVLYPSLKGFRLFKVKGVVYNVLSQKDKWNDEKFFVFDYKYTVSTGKSSVTYKQTVFFFDSKSLELPRFWMKPERWFHRIAAFFGKEDIDFVSHPEFSADYFLVGDDVEAVKRQFDDGVLNFFTVHKSWFLEGEGYYLILYRHNQVIHHAQIRDFYMLAKDMYEEMRIKAS